MRTAKLENYNDFGLALAKIRESRNNMSLSELGRLLKQGGHPKADPIKVVTNASHKKSDPAETKEYAAELIPYIEAALDLTREEVVELWRGVHLQGVKIMQAQLEKHQDHNGQKEDEHDA